MATHHNDTQSDLKVGLLGMGIALVWLLLVSVVSYYLAAH